MIGKLAIGKWGIGKSRIGEYGFGKSSLGKSGIGKSGISKSRYRYGGAVVSWERRVDGVSLIIIDITMQRGRSGS